MAIPYCDDKSLAILKSEQNRVNFLLDSGAFTAWKKGKEIAIDDYCNFIENLPFEPFGYFTLDKIGDPIGTRKNFDEIIRRGFKPIPIFTRGANWNELNEWFEYSDLVGVGGGTGTKGFPFFIRDVSRRVETTGKKIHWLGFTEKDFIARWRPFSCDSSSSNNAIKYRNLIIYLGYGKMKYIHISKFRDDPSNSIQLVRPWLEWCNEDIFKLRDEDGWKLGGVADTITGKTWARYSIECELQFGTKVFFAIGSDYQLRKTLESWTYCATKMGLI